MNKKRGLLLASVAVAVLLGGCVVAPLGGPYYDEPVAVAPPPPRIEAIGTPPVRGYIWIGGFWNWAGGRHEWVPGRWAPPRPGYHWEPRRWDRDGERWRPRGGRWERD